MAHSSDPTGDCAPESITNQQFAPTITHPRYTLGKKSSSTHLLAPLMEGMEGWKGMEGWREWKGRMEGNGGKRRGEVVPLFPISHSKIPTNTT